MINLVAKLLILRREKTRRKMMKKNRILRDRESFVYHDDFGNLGEESCL
jgi:hypothetical protein